MPIPSERRQLLRLVQQVINGARMRPNGFLVYRRYFANDNHGINQTCITQLAAQRWGSMPAELQAPFEAEAAIIAELYNIIYDRPYNLGDGLVMRAEFLDDNFLLVRITPRQNQ